jgi:hypothetical protein
MSNELTEAAAWAAQGKEIRHKKDVERLERWVRYYKELAKDHTDMCAGCERCEVEESTDEY